MALAVANLDDLMKRVARGLTHCLANGCTARQVNNIVGRGRLTEMTYGYMPVDSVIDAAILVDDKAALSAAYLLALNEGNGYQAAKALHYIGKYVSRGDALVRATSVGAYVQAAQGMDVKRDELPYIHMHVGHAPEAWKRIKSEREFQQ